ncbi:MAG: 2-oxoglutarate dehydrogenase complex dihydrolipoyllysine-residue succinyltransferase [Desulfobacteraceae bacterium]|nr:2-oxoglutarate dehydrogenase complex dihydrolipoyllysine-residue succinyltransferase [Desulfobacteraceae bacterium]
MKVELKIPEVGESVQEALLAEWLKKDGQAVRKDEVLFVIETDKVTLEVSAPADGILHILVQSGATVKAGSLVGTIETDAAGQEAAPSGKTAEPGPAEPVRQSEPQPAAREKKREAPTEAPTPVAEPEPMIAPSARRLAESKEVDIADVTPTGPGGRITEGDVLLFLEQHGRQSPSPAPPAPPAEPAAPSRTRPDEDIVRKPMTPIRQRIAERLLDARRNTAMLTTFNEIDMGSVQKLRRKYGEEFKAKHGVRLGLMSFFIQAAVAALKVIPEANGSIEGNDIVYHNYYHIGVAVGAERGLVVPVIRHADRLGFAGLERAIVDFVKKIETNRLEIADLEGGTFTITNGGVYGSLLSTPILNPPQSAILGLHKIENRPVAIGETIVVRPMMYVALSYDHRIIDGRGAVAFLKTIKDVVESPERITLGL